MRRDVLLQHTAARRGARLRHFPHGAALVTDAPRPRCDAAAPACHYRSRSFTSSIVCSSCPSLSLCFFESVLHSLSVRLVYDKSQLGPHTHAAQVTHDPSGFFLFFAFFCVCLTFDITLCRLAATSLSSLSHHQHAILICPPRPFCSRCSAV